MHNTDGNDIKDTKKKINDNSLKRIIKKILEGNFFSIAAAAYYKICE